jgi:predicted secreted protein
MLNVHSLEANLAEYSGLEEDIVKTAIEQGVGFVQLRCPETKLHGIERLPMPKESYNKPNIRESYRKQAEREVAQLKEFVKNGAEIVAVIGAEASPSCGIHYVAKWKLGTEPKDRKWPDTIDFVEGRGVFMEELEKQLTKAGIKPKWIGVPGVSMKKAFPEMFKKTLNEIREL